jgi:hypothetical protein
MSANTTTTRPEGPMVRQGSPRRPGPVSAAPAGRSSAQGVERVPTVPADQFQAILPSLACRGPCPRATSN